MWGCSRIGDGAGTPSACPADPRAVLMMPNAGLDPGRRSHCGGAVDEVPHRRHVEEVCCGQAPVSQPASKPATVRVLSGQGFVIDCAQTQSFCARATHSAQKAAHSWLFASRGTPCKSRRYPGPCANVMGLDAVAADMQMRPSTRGRPACCAMRHL